MCSRQVSWTRASSRSSTGPTSPSVHDPSAMLIPRIPASCTHKRMQKTVSNRYEKMPCTISDTKNHGPHTRTPSAPTHPAPPPLHTHSLSLSRTHIHSHALSHAPRLSGVGYLTGTSVRLFEECAAAAASEDAMGSSPPSAGRLSFSISERARLRIRSM